jgi:hypothetical protein
LPAEVFEPVVPVVVVVVDDAELLCELGVELVAGAVVGAPEVGAALVGAVGAGAACGQDSDSERIGSLSSGSDRSVSGVPGGTSTVNGS